MAEDASIIRLPKKEKSIYQIWLPFITGLQTAWHHCWEVGLNQMENKAAQKYLNQVRHSLICGMADRKRLIERCKELMNAFQQENPDAGYDEFVAAFGQPADCATDLLSTLDDSKVESARQKRLWLRRIIIVSVLGVLVFLSFFWYSKYQKSIMFDEDVIVIIQPPVETTLEEFYAAKEAAKEQEAQFNGGKK